MASIRISGLRSGGRFKRLYQESHSGPEPKSVYLYRSLAADRVNIAFMTLDFLRSPGQMTCLVAAEDLPHGRAVFGDMPAGRRSSDFDDAAGLISVFPHQFDPAVIGMVFDAMARQQCPWHCMASSGSTVALVTDFAWQQEAGQAIGRRMNLPDEAVSILQQDFHTEYDAISRRLKTAPETVAQYVESRIRTYGIQIKDEILVCRLQARPGSQALLAGFFEALADERVRFSYVCADRTADDEVHVAIAMPVTHTGVDSIRSLLAAGPFRQIQIRQNARKNMPMIQNAQMITFHGPHFGDRYGIADKALGCLSGAGVPVWLAGCVGATVTLIVPPDMGRAATDALSASFDSP